MQRVEFRAMGSQMLALVDSESFEAAKALSHVPEWFQERERALSRFRADSELSSLNRSAGQPVRVSDTLWAVLQQAMRAAVESGGLVAPNLLDALIAAGYDRDFASMAEPSESWSRGK